MSATPLQASAMLVARAERGRADISAEEARRRHAATKIEHFVESVVASAPPLTDAQADRIAAILRGSTPAGNG